MNFAPTDLISFGLCGFLHRGRPKVGCWILWRGAETFKVALCERPGKERKGPLL